VSATVSRTESRGGLLLPGARVVLFALLLLASAGCGDSLLGSFGLSQNLGIGLELPNNAAWNMRWYGGEGAATVGSCEIHEATAVALDDSYGGFEMSSPSPMPTPRATVDGGSFSWSLGIPLVTDGSSTVTATASDPVAGIWGIAPFHAIFVASGDLFDLEDALDIGSTDGTELVQGAQWVELFLDPQNPTSLEAAIASTSQDIEFSSTAGYVLVEPLDPAGYHRELLVFANGSDPLGGLSIPDCED